MKKTILLLAASAVMTLALEANEPMKIKCANSANAMQKHTKKNSPFLINKRGLPHMTKLLVQNWDNKELGLTSEQKEKLLVVRKETMKAVKKIKQQLNPLEMEIVEDMKDREDPKSVDSQLLEISKLKLEATRVHLKCISQTTSILSKKQVELLLPFWN